MNPKNKNRTTRKYFFNPYFGTSIGVIIAILLIGYFIMFKSTTYIERPYGIPITDKDFYGQCSRAGWHKIDIGPFELTTPDDYLYTKLRGIDCMVGRFNNSHDTIEFLLGMNVGDFDEPETVSTTTRYEQAGGKNFRFICGINGNKMVAAYTGELYGNNKLAIFCRRATDQTEMTEIFKTITFKK